MDALHVPLAAAAVLLVLSGPGKLTRPSETTRALRMVGVPATDVAVRAFGGVEIVVGAATFTIAGRWWCAATALIYAGFAGFVAIAIWRRTPLASCGCFGRADAPPGVVHLAVDAGLMAVAVLAAADDLRSPLDVLVDGDSTVGFTAATLALSAALYFALTRGTTRQGSPSADG